MAKAVLNEVVILEQLKYRHRRHIVRVWIESQRVVLIKPACGVGARFVNLLGVDGWLATQERPHEDDQSKGTRRASRTTQGGVKLFKRHDQTSGRE